VQLVFSTRRERRVLLQVEVRVIGKLSLSGNCMFRFDLTWLGSDNGDVLLSSSELLENLGSLSQLVPVKYLKYLKYLDACCKGSEHLR
jgi:hypothetical protein